ETEARAAILARRRARVEAYAVVVNVHGKEVTGGGDAHRDLARAGVLPDVRERLLHTAEDERLHPPAERVDLALEIVFDRGAGLVRHAPRGCFERAREGAFLELRRALGPYDPARFCEPFAREIERPFERDPYGVAVALGGRLEVHHDPD